MEEVVEGWVRGRPGVLVVEGAPGRSGELAEEEGRICAFAAVSDEPPHDRVRVSGWGRDRQDEGAVALAGREADRLPD